MSPFQFHVHTYKLTSPNGIKYTIIYLHYPIYTLVSLNAISRDSPVYETGQVTGTPIILKAKSKSSGQSFEILSFSPHKSCTFYFHEFTGLFIHNLVNFHEAHLLLKNESRLPETPETIYWA